MPRETKKQKAERLKAEFLRVQAEAKAEHRREAGEDTPTARALGAAVDTAHKLAKGITAPYKRAHDEVVAKADEKYRAKVDPAKFAYWAALK